MTSTDSPTFDVNTTTTSFAEACGLFEQNMLLEGPSNRFGGGFFETQFVQHFEAGLRALTPAYVLFVDNVITEAEVRNVTQEPSNSNRSTNST